MIVAGIEAEEAYGNALLDRVAIADVIQRERAARDSASWDEMATYYHPDSTVEVAWFQGSGAEFVRLTKKNWGSSGNINFHDLESPVVVLNKDRAIAEMACTLHGFLQPGWRRYYRNGVHTASMASTALGAAVADRWSARPLHSRSVAAL